MGGRWRRLRRAEPDTVKTLTLLAAPDRLRRERIAAQPLGAPRNLRRGRAARRLRQLPRLVSAGDLLCHEPDPELHRQERRVLGGHGRSGQGRRRLRARALAQRQHPGRGRDLPGSSSRSCISATSWCAASAARATGASTSAHHLSPAAADRQATTISSRRRRRKASARTSHRNDMTSMAIGAGHVGLVVGAKAHAKVWPEATRWAAERSTPRPESRRGVGGRLERSRPTTRNGHEATGRDRAPLVGTDR